MDWITNVLLAFLVIIGLALLWKVESIHADQKRANVQHTALYGLLTARQSKMKFDRTSHQSPGVDARARTTRRDTQDIPVRGGTQSPIKFRTVGGTNAQAEEAK